MRVKVFSHHHPLLTTLKTSSTREYYLLALCAAICSNVTGASGLRSHDAQTIEQLKQLTAKKLINNFFIEFPFP